jgi:hypothetical protein
MFSLNQGQVATALFVMFGPGNLFSTNDPSGGDFMRGITKPLKMLFFLTLIQGKHIFEVKMDIFNNRFSTKSGSGKHVQGSGMRAIDSRIKLALIGSFLKRNFRVKKNEKIAQIPIFYIPCSKI